MSYERLNKKEVKVFAILELALTDILKSLNRRISSRSLKSGGKIVVRGKVHKLVFWEYYRAIKNWSTAQKKRFPQGRKVKKT